LATQMLSRLRDQFGAELPITEFFGAPTVAGVAGVLARNRVVLSPAELDADELAAMIAEVKDLSPEEIQELLALEQGGAGRLSPRVGAGSAGSARRSSCRGGARALRHSPAPARCAGRGLCPARPPTGRR